MRVFDVSHDNRCLGLVMLFLFHIMCHSHINTHSPYCTIAIPKHGRIGETFMNPTTNTLIYIAQGGGTKSMDSMNTPNCGSPRHTTPHTYFKRQRPITTKNCSSAMECLTNSTDSCSFSLLYLKYE
jgi:hypothetical protein